MRTLSRKLIATGAVAAMAAAVSNLGAADPAPPADYPAVQSIISQHCLDCHAAQDPEANLVMETYETLLKGGENGPALVPGKSAESLLVKMIEGNIEREGKKKIMPPGKRKKLDPVEIATIKSWIDAGAAGPVEKAAAKELVVPKIAPQGTPRRAVNAFAYDPKGKVFALARYGEVQLFSARSQALLRTFGGFRGNVNALAFSGDGSELFAAGGEAGLMGEVRKINVKDGTVLKAFEGHNDAIYALALSPDGKILATGSYDQKIHLWNSQTAELIRTLSGHNGAIFSLAFRPDGKILASGSADRTVKLWEVASGERKDTLSQPLKAIYAVAFTPDGKRLLAGGVDNRLRVWEVSDTAAETTNPLLYARFAHEGAILNALVASDGKTVLSSAEDGTVKIWEADEIKEKLVLEKQPDWVRALGLVLDNQVVVAARLDGTMAFYDANNGNKVSPPKPELVRVEPRGVERGVETRVKLLGKNLEGVTEAKFHSDKLKAELDPIEKGEEAWIKVRPPADLARGAYELSVAGPNGESGRLKLQVDDLPQFVEEVSTNHAAQVLPRLPAAFWGVLDPPGNIDDLQFEAKENETIVFDLAGRSLGSKANLSLAIIDQAGREVAGSSGFEGAPEPLLAYTFAASGRYTARIQEQMVGGSPDHFYRLVLGSFPYVTGCFPLSVEANTNGVVELIGLNLPAQRQVKIEGHAAGEMEVPMDANTFRLRRPIKLLVGTLAERVEQEPNDAASEATPLPVPGSIAGRIWKSLPGAAGEGRGASDIDLFQFKAAPGKTWIVETTAASRGSPVDTKIEILYSDGKPVERLLLQAVRNSAITFRPIDSITSDARVENWQEMELNEFLYMQGEIAKIFRMPQGPDSGFQFYMSEGKRRAYFDTSGAAHALAEPCYIIEPHAPGSKLASNGLPVFPLYYANDDDGERQKGVDSRLTFIAPKEGTYLVKVTDTRGAGGEDFAYRLTIREAKPDFKVTLKGVNPTINVGSGQAFSVEAERIDGFDDDIVVAIADLPPGFTASNPLVIQAGHSEARGTLNAAADAPAPSEEKASSSKVVASARINGQAVSKEVNNFGRIKLGEKPKLLVSLEPEPRPGMEVKDGGNAPLREIVIAPGETIPVRLKVQRNGHDDLITFTVDNLPHGVIVDNIGLNGVLIPKGENERQIFLTAAKWVPETTRFCFAIEAQAGKQTSLPVRLEVRKKGMQQAASAR